MRLADKSAIVAGAASGIGLAIAPRFSAEGARVVIAGLDRANAEMAAMRTGKLARRTAQSRYATSLTRSRSPGAANWRSTGSAGWTSYRQRCRLDDLQAPSGEAHALLEASANATVSATSKLPNPARSIIRNKACAIAFGNNCRRSTAMADDKSKKDQRDRSQVAGGEDYEIEYLAKKTGISTGAARQLVRTHGSNRAKLEREARKLKA
jgi:NAD(P)-dependent dehydrogenase (short-subunit alcohol dehydrogenase family)